MLRYSIGIKPALVLVLMMLILAVFETFKQNYIAKDMILVSSRLDINKASLEELLALPKLSKTNAMAMIRFRMEHGPYHDLDELAQVIQSKTLRQIQPYVANFEKEK